MGLPFAQAVRGVGAEVAIDEIDGALGLVVGDRRATLTTAGLRLILFGKDKVLERLWAHRLMLVPEIAKAGYDFCVSPS